MAQVCNRLLAPSLDENQLEEKSSLGLSVSIATHDALSSCFKGIETLEINRSVTGAETVYFRNAITKLDTAAKALRRMREILNAGKMSREAIAWLDALDYDRLFADGTKRGQIPPFMEQWSRLVQLQRLHDPAAVANCLVNDVDELRGKIQSMVDTLASNTPSVALTGEQVDRIPTVQTALLQFSTFAQMVSYLNAVEPLDTGWCRQVETAPFVKGNDGRSSLH